MKILVADDSRAMRSTLVELARQWGYDVVSVDNGYKAWSIIVGEDPPQLAILDWDMPGFEGIKLCKMVKQHQQKQELQLFIIILSGKQTKADIVEGLEAGADDYLVKPFHPEELRSRLSAGARAIEYQKVLSEKNILLRQFGEEMQTLAEQRAKQLVHADRMATLGVMSAGVAHEINNPTSFISGNIQTLEMFWKTLSPHIDELIKGNAANTEQLQFIIDEMPKTMAGMRSGVSRIANIVKGLKSFSRKENAIRVPYHIADCIRHALELTHNTLKKNVEVSQAIDEELPQLQGNPQEIEQVMVNLFINAAHAMDPQGGGKLSLRAFESGDELVVVVEDTGPGVPEENLEKIWDPFFSTKGHNGTGLGLSICQGIIEAHGGTLKAENIPEDAGARFTLRVPVDEEQST